MGKEKQSQFKRYHIILFVLLITVLFLITTGSFKSGSSMKESDKNIDSYKSVAELIDNTNLNLDLPSFIINSSDVEIRSFMGMMVELGTNDFVLKAANFVDVNADTLGLYEEAEHTEVFTSDSEVSYVRYRTGYPEYNNCTLVNWCTDTTSYGLMLSGVYDVDTVFELIELNKNDYTAYEDAEVAIENKYLIINNKFRIGVPSINSEIDLYDYDGYTIAYMDKKTCFIIVYNDLDINNKTFESDKKIILDDGVVIYYKDANPFTEKETAYYDYKLLIESISNGDIRLEYIE